MKPRAPKPITGIAVRTHDDKVFFFATDVQSEVEEYMMALGYDSHGIWLRFATLQLK